MAARTAGAGAGVRGLGRPGPGRRGRGYPHPARAALAFGASATQAPVDGAGGTRTPNRTPDPPEDTTTYPEELAQRTIDPQTNAEPSNVCPARLTKHQSVQLGCLCEALLEERPLRQIGPDPPPEGTGRELTGQLRPTGEPGWESGTGDEP